MFLSKLFKRGPKFEPQTKPFGAFGEVTSSKDGSWQLDKPLSLGGYEVEFGFYAKGQEDPVPEYLGRCESIVTNWDTVWEDVRSVVSAELLEDVEPEYKQDYLKQMRPEAISLCGADNYGDPELWELWCEPELMDHYLRVVMKGLKCEGAGLDG